VEQCATCVPGQPESVGIGGDTTGGPSRSPPVGLIVPKSNRTTCKQTGTAQMGGPFTISSISKLHYYTTIASLPGQRVRTSPPTTPNVYVLRPTQANHQPRAPLMFSFAFQPMRCRGGLMFTEALLIPTKDKYLVAPLPFSVTVPDCFIMCSVPATPGAACRTYPTDLDSPLASLASLPPSPPMHLPEFGAWLPASSPGFIVRALTRPPLRLLWPCELSTSN
jgi:hypothetical protein